MGLFSVLKDLAKQVQNKNRANPNVETAPGTIFDKINEAIEDVKCNTDCEEDDPIPEKRTEAVEKLKEKVFEVQRENQSNPNIPTADSSIFDELSNILEKHKDNTGASYSSNDESEVFGQDAEYEEVIPRSSTPASTPPPSFDDDRVIAITNSMGGSLALRAEPDFGAATNEMRIPDVSRVYVVEYSKHSIHLDGKDSRWVLIDFEGQRGWVLEGYLNFN